MSQQSYHGGHNIYMQDSRSLANTGAFGESIGGDILVNSRSGSPDDTMTAKMT